MASVYIHFRGAIRSAIRTTCADSACQRNAGPERRPGAALGRLHLSADRTREPASERQAEPCARRAADGTRVPAETRLENPLALFRANPRAVVPDKEFDRVTVPVDAHLHAAPRVAAAILDQRREDPLGRVPIHARPGAVRWCGETELDSRVSRDRLTRGQGLLADLVRPGGPQVGERLGASG